MASASAGSGVLTTGLTASGFLRSWNLTGQPAQRGLSSLCGVVRYVRRSVRAVGRSSLWTWLPLAARSPCGRSPACRVSAPCGRSPAACGRSPCERVWPIWALTLRTRWSVSLRMRLHALHLHYAVGLPADADHARPPSRRSPPTSGSHHGDGHGDRRHHARWNDGCPTILLQLHRSRGVWLAEYRPYKSIP